MLYLEGPLGSGKSTRLIAETARLLRERPTAEVLVLCSNHVRQRQFIAGLLETLRQPLGQLPVYTYAGYVRNTLFNFWPLVEGEIAANVKNEKAKVRPELSGMEDTELMLKWLLASLKARHPQAYEGFPGNDASIVKQIIRRIRLRSENRLSRKDMRERSMLLNEMNQAETAELELRFDRASYIIRTLDSNKQLDIFHRLLEADETVRDYFATGIRHLIVDDVDETIPAEQRFIEFLAPTVETLMLAADVDGGSRRGYLNAYPYDWQALKRLRPGETVVLERTDPAYRAGQTLLENWRRTENFLPLPQNVVMDDSCITRVEMIEKVVDDILGLLEAGYSAGDFCLILPKTDFLSFYQLQTRLKKRGIPVQLMSGTKRPSDNPKCKAYVYLLQWANQSRWQMRLSPWEIKTLLVQLLGFNHLGQETLDQLLAAINAFRAASPGDAEAPENTFLPPVSSLPVPLPAEAVQRYEHLESWLTKVQALPFEQQIYSAFSEMLAPYSSERDEYGDLRRMIESYLRQKTIFSELRDSGCLEAGVLGDEPAPAQGNLFRKSTDDRTFEQWWLAQVKAGVVADTPEVPEAPGEDAVIIATPQKIIDMELVRKIQFWLDVGSREWARSDNAPLYNAWVHSAVWDGSDHAFSEEFNEAVIRTRAGHITRTLMLLSGEQVRAYASELDDTGFTQAGLLKPRLLSEAPVEATDRLERAKLRVDQEPILEYEKGLMAITAVPGAGKTFVNVELILELIERGTPADRILVLTYMDSAAKTLLGRMKKKLAGFSSKLPVISTIHSLAFRILTDNDHALLLGYMPDDMVILDDYARGEVLAKIAHLTLPESARSAADWQRAVDRGVSHAKMLGVTTEAMREYVCRAPQSFRLLEFIPACQAYEAELKENGYLDFTDLIVKAVELLEKYPDIRAKYQQQFTYIIEDEAQDSSRLLQRFIHLLGGENPNLIRTGDTNQSITTTFSSADTSVFRDFIKQAEQVGVMVQMDRSGRCAPEVVHLANEWMRRASQFEDLTQAFQLVSIKPVVGQNPKLAHAIQAHRFDLEGEEEAWLVERIRKFRHEHPKATVAVLVRGNGQVNRVTSLLHQARIPAVSLSDNINASPIFQVVLSTLKLLESPGDKDLQVAWYQALLHAQLLVDEEQRKLWIETSLIAYHNPVELTDAFLRQWHYDLLEFTQMAAGGNISALIIRMTDQLFQTVADRSNGYLCALMVQEILATHQDMAHLSPLEIIITQFENFQKSRRGNKKSFSEILLQQPHEVVQVMTMHKSKGQEFDAVFMPGLQMDYFPHQAARIRFDESDKLVQDLDRVASPAQAQDESYTLRKKIEKVEEEARLIYVGLTRAKRALFLSAFDKGVTRFGKLRDSDPSMAFKILADILKTDDPGEADLPGRPALKIVDAS